jgi:hypothetical protein
VFTHCGFDRILFLNERKARSKRDCQTSAGRGKKKVIHEKVHAITVTYSQVLPKEKLLTFKFLKLSKL